VYNLISILTRTPFPWIRYSENGMGLVNLGNVKEREPAGWKVPHGKKIEPAL
jgi:hypothetical protein